MDEVKQTSWLFHGKEVGLIESGLPQALKRAILGMI